ncbi:MAG: radical SAM protein [Bdellovibrionota bacterium]
MPAKFFCAAPWLESVLYNDGAYRICSRNSRNFADWRTVPLAETWKGEELREFRRAVAAGEYPDDECASCHAAGTYQSMGRILTTPLNNSLRFLVLGYLITYEEFLYLQKIQELFSLDASDADARVAEYEHNIKGLLFRFRLEGHGEHLTVLKKIQNIVQIIKSYRAGDEAPPLVAPFRQVQLIAKCNARCVMCPGKFTGEIETGGAIAESDLKAAMAEPKDIVDFFCNGSEFLLFKGWREVAQALKAGGVASLRLSTNGMLLTPSTSEHLVDQRVIGHLNISLNAGTRETLERVQKNVRWDRLIANVDHLLAYAEKKKVYFPLSFSFIVMKSNFHELPAFLRRVAEWKRACKLLVPHVMIMSLENAGEKDYRYFLYEEHPSFAQAGELKAAFEETARMAFDERIEAELYNFGPHSNLAAFEAAGFPIPQFVPHPGMDRQNIEGKVREAMAKLRARARDPEELARLTEEALPTLAKSDFAPLFERYPEYDAYRERFARDSL